VKTCKCGLLLTRCRRLWMGMDNPLDYNFFYQYTCEGRRWWNFWKHNVIEIPAR
jgi:hypothetical protein